MADAPGQDLVKTLKDTPARVTDSLTLGPQRRAVGKYLNEKESEAKEWWEKQTAPKAPPRKPVARKRG